MKPENSFPGIGDLLRSEQPDPATPPGLEMRILRALAQRKRPAPKPWWPWLLLPPAFAAIALLFWLRPTAPAPEISSQDHPPHIAVSPDQPVISLVDSANPLNDEALALTRDAQRAGSFLINCLPSVGSPVE